MIDCDGRSASAATSTSDMRAASMRVLIAEDDRLSRILLEKAVEPYGEFVSVDNGRSALEAFEAALAAGSPFDLVLMDIMMPESTGHQVLEGIRVLESQAGVPADQAACAIVVSALTDQKSIARSFFRGQAVTYIPKPVGLTALRQELVRFGLVQDDGRAQA